MPPKNPLSLRLSAEAVSIMKRVSELSGMGRSALVETALREYQAAKYPLPSPTQKKSGKKSE
jgi:hypothetical protein